MTHLRAPFNITLLAFATLALLSIWVTCGKAADDPVVLCNQVCQRYGALCSPDAGSTGTMACQGMLCSMIAQTTCRYSNMSAITAAIDGCLSKATCVEFQICLATTIPAGVGCDDAGVGG